MKTMLLLGAFLSLTSAAHAAEALKGKEATAIETSEAVGVPATVRGNTLVLLTRQCSNRFNGEFLDALEGQHGKFKRVLLSEGFDSIGCSKDHGATVITLAIK